MKHRYNNFGTLPPVSINYDNVNKFMCIDTNGDKDITLGKIYMAELLFILKGSNPNGYIFEDDKKRIAHFDNYEFDKCFVSLADYRNRRIDDIFKED